jgi:isopentenyl-diphosphate delta-isomerase
MIEERKLDHIRVCLEKDVQFSKGNGFEGYELAHRALPEIDRDRIELSTEFLGKRFSAPLYIEAMTGGFRGAGKINRNLAAAAEKLGIGMGVGSQRAAMEDSSLAATYRVRNVAPNIMLFGNLGAAQAANYSIGKIRKAVDMIKADGLVIHLNPAQEMVQKRGDTEWKGILERIREVCSSCSFPVIVKEVGHGISGDVARQLEDAGVAAVDVAGAGGSSWVKIEHYRNREEPGPFSEWGIPTAECLRQCKEAGVRIPLIASGGMRTGLDCAKAIALGASLAGMALPLLKPATESARAVQEKLEIVMGEIRDAMFLAGARNIGELRKVPVSQSQSNLSSQKQI